MPDETATSTLHNARLLTVAMELFRRSLVDSVSFLFANRQKTGPAEWALSVTRAAPAQPTIPEAGSHPPIPMATGAVKPKAEAESQTYPVGQGELPPIPLAGDKPTAAAETYGIKPGDEKPWDVRGGAFGLGTPKMEPPSEPVSAFDRPQSVVIVGPNPLPVSFDFTKIQGGAAAPTVPRGERGAAGEGGAMGMARAIGAKFLAVLAPLYALSTILNQTNSGMGVFQKAINVFGATLAPILLPVFALLAAGLLSVTDIIWAKLLPALGGLYDWALKFGIPVGTDATANAQTIADRAPDLAGKIWNVTKFTGLAAGVADQTMKKGGDDSKLSFMDKLRVITSQDPVQAAKRIAESKVLGPGRQSAGTNPDGTPRQSAGQVFNQNMKDVLRSLSMSMSPKASYSSLGEVGKAAQLSALNADPIEMKAAQRVVQSIQEFMAAFERSQTERQDQISRRPNTARQS